MMECIYNLTFEQLESFFVENGQKKYRAGQVFDWLYKKRVTSFDEMTNLNIESLNLIKEAFDFPVLKMVSKLESADGTVKYLYELKDGNLIESVIMKQKYGNSICVTSQVGCNMGCKFCASGLLKKIRNLDAGEIIAQIIESERDYNKRISHVVVMGIGEPFDNYENLMSFIKNINDHKGLEIGARHITVSTCGIVPKIKEFAGEKLQVNLALSLHAPNDEIRNQIMPINRKYPIKDLIDAIKYYMEKSNRRITIEYILLKDLNDQKEHALELAKLLRGLNVYVNLIPYNEVFEAPFKQSNKDTIIQFRQVLIDNKINAILREEHGSDIDAACGQLRSQTIKGAKKT